MSGNLGFETTQYKPSEGYTPLPAGEYPVRVSNTEKLENKKGNGHQLKVTFDVLDGDFKGRKIFNSFNLWHDSEKTRDIAREQFSGLIKAIGINPPRNHEEVRDGKVIIRLVVESDPQYGDSNNVKGYKPLEGVAPAAAAEKPAQAASSGKPW